MQFEGSEKHEGKLSVFLLAPVQKQAGSFLGETKSRRMGEGNDYVETLCTF